MAVTISGNIINGSKTGIAISDSTGKLELLIKENRIENSQYGIEMFLDHKGRVSVIDNTFKEISSDAINLKTIDEESLFKLVESVESVEAEITTVEKTNLITSIKKLNKCSNVIEFRQELINLSLTISNEVVIGLIVQNIIQFISG